MLLERYDISAAKGGPEDDDLLGDRVNGRSLMHTKLHRSGVSAPKKVKSFRGSFYKRGNSFSSRPISQRVVVKAHFKKHSQGSKGAGNLRGHLSYITRSGAGVNGERPELFGGEEGVPSRSAFYNICEEDRHHFRFIISPENAYEIEDMPAYIERVMGAVEKDLGTKLEWVSAVHYDTDNPHAHVVVRGKDDLGRDLVIAPDYISSGIRGRASEIATEILGELSLEELRRSMEAEVGALRVTSLDRFIAAKGRAVEDGLDGTNEIRVNARLLSRNPRDEFRVYLVKERLKFLTSTSMAREVSRDIYRVRRDFMDELRETSEKHDIIKQLHRSGLNEEQGARPYFIKDGHGPVVRGEIESIAHVNELTDHKYALVRDGVGQLHYVPLALNARNQGLSKGSVVMVEVGDRPERKADVNILDAADDNGGVYTRGAHLKYVQEHMGFIEDAGSYVDYHQARVLALSEAGVIKALEGEGGYAIPEDLLERGESVRGRAQKYPQIRSLSASAIEDKGFVVYDAKNSDAPAIKGRVESVERVSASGEQRYMLVRDGEEKAHYVPLALTEGNKKLRAGAIVEISPKKSKGGADYNIAEIAQENGGIYRREDHLSHILASKPDLQDPESYVDYHGVRLQTLEKAGIVSGDKDSGYAVPDDVAARGAALNEKLEKRRPKREYAQVKVISAMPLEKQIDVQARTFLDLEIHRHQNGYDLSYATADKGTLDALHKRQDWLESNGYGHHREEDGKFMMKGDALRTLHAAELDRASENLGKALNQHVKNHNFNEKQTLRYIGFADLHAGRHLAVGKNGDFCLVKKPFGVGELRKGEPLDIQRDGKGLRVSTTRQGISKEEAIALAVSKAGLDYKELNLEHKTEAKFLGAINLKSNVYAAVSHEDKLSFVKLKEYPVYERGSEVELSCGADGFANIKSPNKQRELSLKARERDDKDIEMDV